MNANTELRIPEFADIRAAQDRIRGLVKLTPVAHREAMDRALGCEVWMKCENRQTTGAFKLRGASNAIACLREAGDTRNVATHSSGNHGAALALAAQRDGRGAHVVMPENSVPAKIAAVRSHGAQVILCAPSQQAREAGLAELVRQGMAPIPPYEHFDIIAGQGTAAIELIEFMDKIDILVTPVGGGGLLAGSAIAARALRPDITIYGAEPEGAADTFESFHKGRRLDDMQADTVCDGLRALIGGLNFDIIKAQVDDILLVSEEATENAMKQVWEHMGTPIEPSSAVAIAAINLHPQQFAGARTGVILTGGNVDLELFPWLRERSD